MSKDFHYQQINDGSCMPFWYLSAEEDVRAAIEAWNDSSFDELESWYEIAHTSPILQIQANAQLDESLEVVFRTLSERWEEETWAVSSIKRKIAHPAYLQIIGMGAAALPFIFDDLRKRPALWFWALDAITREEVAPEVTSMRELRDAWMLWAEAHGY